MSTPLPTDLAALERALESTRAEPAPDLRARVLEAARLASSRPASLRPSAPSQRQAWLAATAAAFALLLFNLARSAAFHDPRAHAASSLSLCAAVQIDPDAARESLDPALFRACQQLQAASIKE